MKQCSSKGSFQKLLSGFFPLRGGGYSPFPLRVFGHNDFPLREGGGRCPPIPLRKKSAKNSYFRPKNANFSPFWPIFLEFFLAIFRYPPFPLRVFGQDDFPLRGGGVPPNSVKEKIRLKTAIFGQKTLILALFDLFVSKFFLGFSVKGGGVTPQFR